MNQQDANTVIAIERMQELGRLHDELGTIKWIGLDHGWNSAIAAVRTQIEKRIIELAHKYTPEAVDAALAQRATVSGKGNA